MNEMTRRRVFLEEIGLGPLWLGREAALEMVLTPQFPAVVEEIFMPAADYVEPLPRADKAAAQPVIALPITAPATTINTVLSAWSEDAARISPPSTAMMDWPQLRKAVAVCTACGLCRGRENTVFGAGDSRAKWLFIGDGPGRHEDSQGEPFVGPSGKLLDNLLLAMGLARGENTYVTNILKCRPTDDDGRERPPSAEQVAACLPYLQRQIDLIQPTVLVALGKSAALSLLGLDPDTPIDQLRGKVHRYADRPLIVTYHPDQLLRQPADKEKVWRDLCLALSNYASIAE